MEPDNLGGIIPPRKRIHYIAPRGDWLGSKLGGRINHPHKLIGFGCRSIFNWVTAALVT